MPLTLSYEVQHDLGVTSDELISGILRGFTAYAADQGTGAAPDVSYSRKEDSSGASLALTVSYEPDEIKLKERRAAGLVMILSGTPFRDARIRRATLTEILMREDPGGFPGPRYGQDLLSTDSSAISLSVPLPKSFGAPEFFRKTEVLLRSGVSILTDLKLDSSMDEIRRRALHLASIKRPTLTPLPCYFVNATTSLIRIDQISDMIEATRDEFVNRLIIGVRLCPICVGYAVLEHLRLREIPVYAYTLAPVPSGDLAWSPGAYASLMNLLGADIVNVGLLSPSLLERGSLLETLLPLQRRRETGKKTIPALSGGVTPEVAYRYGETLQYRYILHTLTPILGGDPDLDLIERRVRATVEAATAGQKGLEASALFASNDKRVRNWQTIADSGVRRGKGSKQ